MIDVNLLLRTWLLIDQINGETNPVPVFLSSLFVAGGAFPNDNADRVYTGHLPPGFDPQYGPAVLLRVGSGTQASTGGGSAHPEIPLIMPRMQITTWAQKDQYGLARQTYRAVYDWIQRRNNISLTLPDASTGYVLGCLENVEGQDVDDPHTGFATTVSFWGLTLREQAA